MATQKNVSGNEPYQIIEGSVGIYPTSTPVPVLTQAQAEMDDILTKLMIGTYGADIKPLLARTTTPILTTN